MDSQSAPPPLRTACTIGDHHPADPTPEEAMDTPTALMPEEQEFVRVFAMEREGHEWNMLAIIRRLDARVGELERDLTTALNGVVSLEGQRNTLARALVDFVDSVVVRPTLREKWAECLAQARGSGA